MRDTLSKRTVAKLGQVGRFKITDVDENAFYLDAQPLGFAFLSKRAVKQAVKIGDSLEVFLHKDAQDRLVASLDIPKYKEGDVAFLRVKQVVAAGAFMDWGAKKDLFVPMSEQRVPMLEGRSYVVVLYTDSLGRLAASSKLSLFLEEHVAPNQFKLGQEVECLVASRSDLGYSLVIQDQWLGLVHTSLVSKPLRMGQKLSGYIQAIRDDGKISVTLQKPGQAGRDDLAEKVLAHLRENGGESTLTDYSHPDEIFEQYRVSKALYKKTLSQLYKARKILISPEKIELN